MSIGERPDTGRVNNHFDREGILERTYPRRQDAHASSRSRRMSTLYRDVARRSWKVILLCLVLGLALGWLAASLVTPQYQSTSQVFVAFQSADDSPQSMLQGANFAQHQVLSYADIVTSPLVLQPVIDSLELEDDAQVLGERVEATALQETVLIDITVTDSSPTDAARVADAIALSLGEVIPGVERPDGVGGSPVQITTVRPAVVPTTPSAPNAVFIVLMGGAVGLSAGVAYTLFAQSRRGRPTVTATNVIASRSSRS